MDRKPAREQSGWILLPPGVSVRSWGVPLAPPWAGERERAVRSEFSHTEVRHTQIQAFFCEVCPQMSCPESTVCPIPGCLPGPPGMAPDPTPVLYPNGSRDGGRI